MPGAVLREVAERYRLPAGTSFDFLRHGENTIYAVRAPDGRRYALRVHRPGYQTPDAIRSELAWMDSLRAAGVATPPALAGIDGDPLQRLVAVDRDGDPGDAAGARAEGDEVSAEGDEVTVAMFEWVQGTPLSAVGEVAPWQRLGEIMARLHEHSRGWRRPPRFVRPAWDGPALVGDSPRWGPPDPHRAFDPESSRLLQRCRAEVQARLSAIGSDENVYGLIHGDLGFENVLVGANGDVAVIDFDDSGDSWFLHDLAVALYPHEGSVGFDERRDALVAGYRRAGELPEEVLSELPTFLMARRIASLGWVFSRAETEHARRQRSRRLRSTPGAARAFLAWAQSHPVASIA